MEGGGCPHRRLLRDIMEECPDESGIADRPPQRVRGILTQLLQEVLCCWRQLHRDDLQRLFEETLFLPCHTGEVLPHPRGGCQCVTRPTAKEGAMLLGLTFRSAVRAQSLDRLLVIETRLKERSLFLRNGLFLPGVVRKFGVASPRMAVLCGRFP